MVNHRTLFVPFTAVSAALALIGCSEMKFVNASDTASQVTHDPRRDIHLTGVVTEMTSGTALVRRVVGDRGIYSEDLGLIRLEKARIEPFREEGGLQGVTTSDHAIIYLADQPTSAVHRRDMEFAGNFRYRAPAEHDPTTDSLSLSTERLVWDEEAKLFRAPLPYRMISSAPGKPPMVLKGRQFVATRDLQSFSMEGGSLTNDPHRDAREALAPLGEEIRKTADELAVKYRPAPLPTPIEIPTSASATGYPVQNILQQAEKIHRGQR